MAFVNLYAFRNAKNYHSKRDQMRKARELKRKRRNKGKKVKGKPDLEDRLIDEEEGEVPKLKKKKNNANYRK
jgi:hypothetical protein